MVDGVVVVVVVVVKHLGRRQDAFIVRTAIGIAGRARPEKVTGPDWGKRNEKEMKRRIN